jgi:cysteinyl-tRNA synthetase
MRHEVVYVRNFTDIDKKILDTMPDYARKDEYMEYVNKAIVKIRSFLSQVTVTEPNYEPRVTNHISEFIHDINDMLNKKVAIEVHDGVVFLPTGAYLWRNSTGITWESPWGDGIPGWHIECYSFIKKYLGETIDIHGGGVDLITPHHQNEKAMGASMNGKPLSSKWFYIGMLIDKYGKMSKSSLCKLRVSYLMHRFGGQFLRTYYFTSDFRRSQLFMARDFIIKYRLYAKFQLWRYSGVIKVGETPALMLTKCINKLYPYGLNTQALMSWLYQAPNRKSNSPMVADSISFILGIKEDRILINKILDKIKRVGKLLEIRKKMRYMNKYIWCDRIRGHIMNIIYISLTPLQINDSGAESSIEYMGLQLYTTGV